MILTDFSSVLKLIHFLEALDRLHRVGRADMVQCMILSRHVFSLFAAGSSALP